MSLIVYYYTTKTLLKYLISAEAFWCNVYLNVYLLGLETWRFTCVFGRHLQRTGSWIVECSLLTSLYIVGVMSSCAWWLVSDSGNVLWLVYRYPPSPSDWIFKFCSAGNHILLTFKLSSFLLSLSLKGKHSNISADRESLNQYNVYYFQCLTIVVDFGHFHGRSAG